MIEWIPIGKQRTRKDFEVYKVSDEKANFSGWQDIEVKSIVCLPEGKWGKVKTKYVNPDDLKNWHLEENTKAATDGYDKYPEKAMPKKKRLEKLTFKDMLNKMKENEEDQE